MMVLDIRIEKGYDSKTIFSGEAEGSTMMENIPFWDIYVNSELIRRSYTDDFVDDLEKTLMGDIIHAHTETCYERLS